MHVPRLHSATTRIGCACVHNQNQDCAQRKKWIASCLGTQWLPSISSYTALFGSYIPSVAWYVTVHRRLPLRLSISSVHSRRGVPSHAGATDDRLRQQYRTDMHVMYFLWSCVSVRDTAFSYLVRVAGKYPDALRSCTSTLASSCSYTQPQEAQQPLSYAIVPAGPLHSI